MQLPQRYDGISARQAATCITQMSEHHNLGKRTVLSSPSFMYYIRLSSTYAGMSYIFILHLKGELVAAGSSETLDNLESD